MVLTEGLPLGNGKNYSLKEGSASNTFNLYYAGQENFLGLICVFTKDELKSIEQIVKYYIEKRHNNCDK